MRLKDSIAMAIYFVDMMRGMRQHRHGIVPEQCNRASQKSCVHSAEKLGLQRLARVMIFSDFSRVLSQEGVI